MKTSRNEINDILTLNKCRCSHDFEIYWHLIQKIDPGAAKLFPEVSCELDVYWTLAGRRSVTRLWHVTEPAGPALTFPARH